MFVIVLVSIPPSISTVFWYSCMFAEKISTRTLTIPAWPWLYVILHNWIQLINQSCLKPTSWQIGSWQFSVISKPVPIFLRANVLIDLQFLRLPTCCRFLQTSNLQPVAQPPCSAQRWPVADFCNGKEFFADYLQEIFPVYIKLIVQKCTLFMSEVFISSLQQILAKASKNWHRSLHSFHCSWFLL